MRRPMIAGVAITLLAVFAAAPGAWAAERPNVVYFLVDDAGFADVGFNGGTDVRTPVIDRLAAGGTTFKNYYVQAVCSVSRACLLTGRLPIRHGIYGALKNDATFGLPTDERTIAQALHTAGYTTAIVGKWHLGDAKPDYLPTHRGFDHEYGIWLGQIDSFTHVSADGFGHRPDWHRDDQPSDDKGYATNLLAAEAVRLIREQPKGKPLFLYLPFTAIHGPWMVPTKYEEPFADLPPDRRVVVAMQAAVDEAIGQVMDAVKTAGMGDDTLVVFSSDNGGDFPDERMSNKPLRDGKGSLYEGGIRSAAFAFWPGHIPAGKSVADPVHLIDWYPTLVHLTGAEEAQSKPVDGVDLWPLLTTGKPLGRDALLIAGGPRRHALRLGDWKLLVNPVAVAPARAGTSYGSKATQPRPPVLMPKVDPIELYDLSKDPSETKNLAGDQPDRVKQMTDRGRQMMAGAEPPLANPPKP